MFVVLRVRGTSKLDGDVKDTLEILSLRKPHQCTFVPNTPSYVGMLKKVEGCTAWGEVKPELLEKLIEKRGRPAAESRNRGSDAGRGKSTDPKAKKVISHGSKLFEASSKIDAKAAAKKILEGKIKESGINPVLKLMPPKNGFAKKGVLHGFNQGGELGYQKEKINELIERMI